MSEPARVQRYEILAVDDQHFKGYDGEWIKATDLDRALTSLRQRCAYRVLHYVLHYRKNMGLEARQQLAAAILDVPLEE